jgi:putative tryptophan/tyrosine transport system substrate-binding protein
MNRRAFTTLLGGAAAWPLGARAQQTAMPVVGFVNDSGATGDLATAFRNGLSEAGFVEGRNVAIEYRWANSQYDQVPRLVADLLRRQVAVIAATGTIETVVAAKEATATIPIVFTTGGDPVKAGLVAALNKPGGNITGITSTNAQLGAKWIGLMHDLLPNATRFALLVNPRVRANTAGMATDIQGAAATIGLQVEVLYAEIVSELETALASAAQRRVGCSRRSVPRPPQSSAGADDKCRSVFSRSRGGPADARWGSAYQRAGGWMTCSWFQGMPSSR